MLIDARSLADGTTIELDLCIVGAGPAGLTIAKTLAGKGIRIAVLESGGLDFDAASDALTEGEYTGIDIEPLETTRMRALGGTTIVWNGHCRMFDPHDFEHRAWIPYSGWPFDFRALEPYYAKAHEIIGFRPVAYDIGFWAKRLGTHHLPVDDDAVFHRVSLIRPLDFWSDYAADLASADDVAIYTFATTLAIRADAQGRSVRHLDIATAGGKRITVQADRYVLACGGIENARLLLLSNDVHANGLGNQYDLVGRFFMEHPRFRAGTLLLSRQGLPGWNLYSDQYLADGISIRADLGLRASVQERELIGNVLGRIQPANRPELGEGSKAARRIFNALRQGHVPDRLMEDMWATLSEFDDVVADAYRKLYAERQQNMRTFELQSYIEQVPNPDSRVVLSERRDRLGQPRAHLVWKLTDLDRRTALRAVELFAQAVGAHDVGRIRIETAIEDIFPPDTGWGHHHMGTTRMSDDPRQGVVDRFGRIHGMSNLYVAGSSVYPTSSCATPTLTLVALAARLADHLQAVYKRA